MKQALYEPSQQPGWWTLSRNRLVTLVVLTVLAIVAFMTVGVEADWAFVLEHRGTKVLTMLVVACALGMSTVVFQTVTHNTILTPAVMGLDALYLFLQSVLVLVLGSVGVVGLGVMPKFGLEIVLMVVLSVALMRWLFTGHASSLHLMLLVGMVFGILFRSMTSFVMRMIDPNEFATPQDRMFANFNTIHTELLWPSLVLLALGAAYFWRQRHVLDVLALGRDADAVADGGAGFLAARKALAQAAVGQFDRVMAAVRRDDAAFVGGVGGRAALGRVLEGGLVPVVHAHAAGAVRWRMRTAAGGWLS